ncbi:MAG: hypothetical protein JWL64_2880, partial [Frankiales bacterium]|nr:hypothetical protein [Frankiales bacterium]
MKTLFPARPRVARPVRLFAVTATLALAVTACGGTDQPSAAPSASAGPTVTPVETRACPISTTPAPASPGISADLSVKPVVPAHPAPAPAGITVADVKVGDGATVVVGT